MLEMSGENPKEKKTRRKFEPEFKNDAVRLVELGSQSIKEVATELDMSEATLLNWVKGTVVTPPGAKNTVTPDSDAQTSYRIRVNDAWSVYERFALRRWAVA